MHLLSRDPYPPKTGAEERPFPTTSLEREPLVLSSLSEVRDSASPGAAKRLPGTASTLEKRAVSYGGGASIALLCAALLCVAGCTSTSEKSENALFASVPAASSNIDFENELSSDGAFNIYTYKDFYGGGGVALGDVNGDGLLDIYLVANQHPNKLYLNKGDFQFEDITDEAGVGGTKPWSTGVSMADVNGDGLLDIYVTNAGAPDAQDRENELFINNGDLTFSEEAQAFGLADVGYSIHAVFFDYDRDGDLDVYVLNNYASKRVGEYNLQEVEREAESVRGGDRLYRNELISEAPGSSNGMVPGGGEGFIEVTEAAGVYSNEIGFGLGASVGDVDRDGWADVYVSNDFFEYDYLYLNNRDGTFREALKERVSSISTTSMGGDIADLDNDGFPEVFVTDMLPGREERLKKIADFTGWEAHRSEVEMGYHHQFERNTLQYNDGKGAFREVGRYAGVEASGWSWGALMADFDLDGLRDIFVPNGVYKDITDKDLMVKLSQREVMQEVVKNNQIDYERLLEMAPSNPLSNYVFANQGDMRFAGRASEWGLDRPSFSTGSAYGDLDGDGDLDLVVNNVNMSPFVYRNRASEQHPEHRWIQLELEGDPPNTQGVGAQVELTADGHRWYAEQMPQRGFQSSVDPTLHVGLGAGIATVDTLRVRWPDGRVSLQTDVATGQRLTLRQAEAPTGEDHAEKDRADEGGASKPAAERTPMLADVTDEVGLDWAHEESAHNDFERSPLLFHMRSTEGPPLCSGDVNGDGRADVYVGGARGQPGALLVQHPDGRFETTHPSALHADREAEDTDCLFFDADGDGTPELYVASGSSEFPAGSAALADRLYRVDAAGELVRVADALPWAQDEQAPTGAVRAADLDGDGDQDLFVGARMTPTSYGAAQDYGVPVGGALLENDGTGRFEEATDRRAPQLRAPELQAAGVADAAWGDLDGDGAPDLVVAGEWMPLTVFFNRNGRLERADPASVGLAGTRGWWQRLVLADLNGNGALDLVGGNHGLNSRFRASPERPVHLWAGDFSRNGRVEHVFASYNGTDGPYPVALRHDLIEQLPHLKARYPTFADYAGTAPTDLLSREQREAAAHHRVEQLASVIGWNDGDGRFRVDSLPFRAQLAPMYGMAAADVDGDDVPEILIGGNLSAARPQAGAYDAARGTVLRQDADGRYRAVPTPQSGFVSPGEIRAIQPVRHEGRLLLFVARNDDRLLVFRPTTP